MKPGHCIKVLVAMVALAAVAAGILPAAEAGETVLKAYELRMAGKAADAKTLLEAAIAENPKNAAAHFELARTMFHMGLADPSSIAPKMEKGQELIRKAIELEPENPTYILFGGYVAFMHAYMSMKEGGADTREKVGRICSLFEKAAKTRTDYLAPMLYLVEIYGILPEEMGGDKAKAEELAGELEKKDAVFGAKARSLLLPDDADKVAYWKKVLAKHAGNADVLEELGKAYLYNENVAEGSACLEKAIEADPGRKVLILDIARYHIMTVMQGAGSKEEALKAAEKAAKRYLETDPIPPMRAYALEILAKVKFGMEDEDAVKELREQASRIDPFHSKASGVPCVELFLPPDEVSHSHKYLFRWI